MRTRRAGLAENTHAKKKVVRCQTFATAHRYELWVPERKARKISDGARLGRREKEGLSVTREVLEDGLHCLTEPHVENAIRLVHH